MNTDKIPVLYEKDRPQAVFTKAFNIITVAEVTFPFWVSTNCIPIPLSFKLHAAQCPVPRHEV